MKCEEASGHCHEKEGRLKALLMNRLAISFVAVFIIVWALVLPAEARQADKRTRVFVSILPQAYFVERIGGSAVSVEVLVGPGQSPATYEPTPRQMARLGAARVYFRIGTPFERGFIEKLETIFPDLLIVDTRQNVPFRYFKHGREGEVPDPHIWLDPKRVKIQAVTICDALMEIDPENSAIFRKNLQSFEEDLKRIDRENAGLLAPFKGRKIYVFHPAFGYFAESYGLQQVAMEVAGKEPSPKQLATLIEETKRNGVKAIFIQQQFSQRDAKALAKQIGCRLVSLDPLSRNYLENLAIMAGSIKSALAP